MREISKGDFLYYGTDRVKVLDVHNDDVIKYYTIQFIDGREKQTIKEYLTLREDKLFELKKKVISQTF